MSVFTNNSSSTPEEIAQYVAALLGLLGDRDPRDVLAQTEAALQARISSVSPDLLKQREAPGKWSAAHVLQHLADSDLVFGFRLRMILAHDRPGIPGYDQDAFADRLYYDDADPAQSLADFGAVRSANLRLLARLSPEDMKRVGVHAERGEESVAHLIKLYAGHDLLHLRQLDRVLGTVAA